MKEETARLFKVTVYRANGRQLKFLSGLSRYGAKKAINRLGKVYNEQVGYYITLEEEE